MSVIYSANNGSEPSFTRGVARYLSAHSSWTLRLHPYSIAAVRQVVSFDRPHATVVQSPDQEAIAILKAYGRPVISVVDERTDGPFPVVTHDEYAIGRSAAEHLLSRGHRHFAFLGTEGGWSRGREKGFVETVQAAVCTCAITSKGPDGKGRWTWYELFRPRRLIPFLRGLPSPVGVLTANDEIALNLLEVCRREGIRVPDDLGIVAVDNTEINCRFARVPLSSVDTDLEGVGYLAAQTVDRLLNGTSVPPVQAHPPRGVIVRASSDRYAIDDADFLSTLDIVRKHACRGLTVQTLSRLSLVPRRSLERQFQQRLGRSPRDEIMRARIGQAEMLLRESEIKVIAISTRCGFAYQSHFAAAFRRVTGTTPLQYRARWRAEVVHQA